MKYVKHVWVVWILPEYLQESQGPKQLRRLLCCGGQTRLLPLEEAHGRIFSRGITPHFAEHPGVSHPWYTKL
jgi:hypothetical protein